jgi:hypothetical protein
MEVCQKNDQLQTITLHGQNNIITIECAPKQICSFCANDNLARADLSRLRVTAVAHK